ncbi:Coenzyme F420 hydrogenase/dehydrogenase, beta subunit C-terminal domain [Methanogenium marinum]|uniref:Coenzyme F420 hydrogenase/dehydrogenase, beta subunit C-terminal domain n=1 Tax=Methanogenium marinum TaxID=348610 RepID=A0A9Q4PUK8_9EURY|nr:Coenzyme F420 hydrogenase/dehydrogenase, beta subunit C-terminal domain [Methanogenium marinum]MDE4907015.1 Coenzyme F420 hydrogenase/dehydrogenase, beta subunit C-terminal domain [Methanogenium marinum]
MPGKNYQNLKEEVWDTGICSGCGACVAVCPADAIIFTHDENIDSPVQTGYCKEVTDNVPCGACYAVCPRTAAQETARMEKTGLGEYTDIFAAHAGFDVEKRQSGGAVTAILANALEEGLVDAVITVTADPWTQKPESVIITKTEALVATAGSRYAWWVPTLAALKSAVVTQKIERIAIVGVPCAVSAARMMKTSDHDLLRPFGRAIRLIVGLFCTETFDYEMLIKDKIIREMSIEPWQIAKLDVRGKLIIETTDKAVREIPLRDLEDCVRKGCHACGDMTAVDADISAGSVGSPDGETTLIVRTPIGVGFIDHATETGRLVIEKDACDLKGIIHLSQKKSERIHT